MKNTVIIGSGPAGISAALYLVRSGKTKVKIISKNESALKKADKIENYFGFAEPVSGEKLLKDGIDNAKRLGVDFLDDEVVGIGFTDDMKYEVMTSQDKFMADAVLIATGASRKIPNIKNLAKFEGKGVSYCAVCDAFFFKGKNTCVIGNGEYAVHEALVLKNTSSSVTILTNGLEMTAEIPEGVNIITKKIEEIDGNIKVEKILFDDGTEFSVDGIFIALGIAGSADFARKLGAETENGRIKVNASMETNVPGLYAAGDCTGGLLQIAKAVSDGAIAAMSMIPFLKNQ